jgi:uncharacterized protein (DUF433 family)
MLENGQNQANQLQDITWAKDDPLNKTELISEWVGGEIYEYYPLGAHIVAALGVCGGRPTFKYTRIEATGALNLMAAGYTLAQIAQRFAVPLTAVEEALHIAAARLNNWKIAA